ncbi:hypothetical protein FOL46_003765 [Perkinsus olseni]|nr:hypothetical protein FOL46_003765 [Perkinsus olseni]
MSEDSLVDWQRGRDEGTADGEALSVDDAARHRGIEAVADEEISGRESSRIEECALIQDSLDVAMSRLLQRAYYWGTVVSRSFCFEKKRTFIFKKAAPLGDTEKLRGKDSQEHWPPGNRAGDLQLPSELNRKLFVYNSRHTCGRKRSTVLMITQGDRHKPILTLNREEFEGVMAAREEVEKEIVNFGKKLLFVGTWRRMAPFSVLTLGILSANHRQFSRCESSKDWRQGRRVSIFAMGSVGPELERTRRGAQRLSFLPDERWARVTLGDGFGGAVTEDGKAWLWRKRNGIGKNGNSAAVSKPIPLPRGVRAVDIQSSKTSLWLLGDDGRVYVVQNVVATGARNSISMCPGFPEGIRFSEIAVSAAHFVGLDQEGGVWCFGDNTRGQCGADPSIQAMLGGAARVVLGKKGRYVREPRGVKIAAGDYHTIVLDDNGEVWTWGDDTLLQLGHGDTRWAPSNASSKLPGESMKEKKPPSGTSASRPLVTYEPFETHLRFTPTKIADVPTDFDQQHTQELATNKSGLAPEGIFAGPSTSFLVINDTPYDHIPHDEHQDAVYACGDNERGQCGRSLQYPQQTFMRVRLPKRIQVQMLRCSSGHCAAWVRRVGHTLGGPDEGPVRDWGIYTWGENTAGKVSTTRRHRDVVIPPLDVTKNFPRGAARWLAVGPHGTAVIAETLPSTSSTNGFLEAYRAVVNADAELATAVGDRQALYRNTVEMGTGRSVAWTGVRGQAPRNPILRLHIWNTTDGKLYPEDAAERWAWSEAVPQHHVDWSKELSCGRWTLFIKGDVVSDEGYSVGTVNAVKFSDVVERLLILGLSDDTSKHKSPTVWERMPGARYDGVQLSQEGTRELVLKLVFFMRDSRGSMVEVPPEIEKVVTGRRRITMPTLIRSLWGYIRRENLVIESDAGDVKFKPDGLLTAHLFPEDLMTTGPAPVRTVEELYDAASRMCKSPGPVVIKHRLNFDQFDPTASEMVYTIPVDLAYCDTPLQNITCSEPTSRRLTPFPDLKTDALSALKSSCNNLVVAADRLDFMKAFASDPRGILEAALEGRPVEQAEDRSKPFGPGFTYVNGLHGAPRRDPEYLRLYNSGDFDHIPLSIRPYYILSVMKDGPCRSTLKRGRPSEELSPASAGSGVEEVIDEVDEAPMRKRRRTSSLCSEVSALEEPEQSDEAAQALSVGAPRSTTASVKSDGDDAGFESPRSQVTRPSFLGVLPADAETRPPPEQIEAGEEDEEEGSDAEVHAPESAASSRSSESSPSVVSLGSEASEASTPVGSSESEEGEHSEESAGIGEAVDALGDVFEESSTRSTDEEVSIREVEAPVTEEEPEHFGGVEDAQDEQEMQDVEMEETSSHESDIEQQPEVEGVASEGEDEEEAKTPTADSLLGYEGAEDSEVSEAVSESAEFSPDDEVEEVESPLGSGPVDSDHELGSTREEAQHLDEHSQSESDWHDGTHESDMGDVEHPLTAPTAEEESEGSNVDEHQERETAEELTDVHDDDEGIATPEGVEEDVEEIEPITEPASGRPLRRAAIAAMHRIHDEVASFTRPYHFHTPSDTAPTSAEKGAMGVKKSSPTKTSPGRRTPSPRESCPADEVVESVSLAVEPSARESTPETVSSGDVSSPASPTGSPSAAADEGSAVEDLSSTPVSSMQSLPVTPAPRPAQKRSEGRLTQISRSPTTRRTTRASAIAAKYRIHSQVSGERAVAHALEAGKSAGDHVEAATALLEALGEDHARATQERALGGSPQGRSMKSRDLHVPPSIDPPIFRPVENEDNESMASSSAHGDSKKPPEGPTRVRHSARLQAKSRTDSSAASSSIPSPEKQRKSRSSASHSATSEATPTKTRKRPAFAAAAKSKAKPRRGRLAAIPEEEETYDEPEAEMTTKRPRRGGGRKAG